MSRLTIAATLCISALAAQESEAVLAPTVRFQGDIVMRLKNGATKTVHAVLTDWGIHGTSKIERFPAQGFLVVQLHSGYVTVVINGKEEKHRGGDFWSVPAGASMSVQVTSESAVLQTMAIK